MRGLSLQWDQVYSEFTFTVDSSLLLFQVYCGFKFTEGSSLLFQVYCGFKFKEGSSLLLFQVHYGFKFTVVSSLPVGPNIQRVKFTEGSS